MTQQRRSQECRAQLGGGVKALIANLVGDKVANFFSDQVEGGLEAVRCKNLKAIDQLLQKIATLTESANN